MADRQSSLFDTAPDPWELDSAEEKLVAEIVFAETPHGPYDYSVPTSMAGKLRPGQRVQVSFGQQREPRTGYCTAVGVKELRRPLKPIKALVDVEPLLADGMLKLTRWMADHYLCPWGQVLQGVIPSGVRGQAGTREMTFLAVAKEVLPLVKALAPLAEKLALEGADKSTKKVSLSPEIELPPKQFIALQVLANSPRPLTAPELCRAARCTMNPVNELRRKRLIEGTVQRIQNTEIDEVPAARESHLHLQPDQEKALDSILQPLKERRHETILLYGITGSGKTEVYIRAIDEVIGYGRQAIVLVPEISLTPQTRERFRSRFEQVAVLHSHLSDSERHWHWQRIARGEVQVVVGARSAVFAPTPHLGLIVIDEEHDPSFKQGETPRYHARDVALARAKQESVPLVLGSATPALETWQRGLTEEFRLVEMPRRVSDRPLPIVDIVDLRHEFRERVSTGAIGRQLTQGMKEALAAGGQVILLLNRRGYSTNIQCPACGFVVRCPHCDLPLTHHREEEKLRCHYCDFLDTPPTNCPECRFDGIRYSGFGTEKLEAELRAKFRDVPLLRMDSDTMQKPGSHEAALAKFRAGEVKILLGTQMIAKGLDFPNVTLVGVINADTALHFTDFRAAERTFQLVTQVAGRTGRGDKLGRVLVQTFSPDHIAITSAARHDYRQFAFFELPARKDFQYPPYATLVRLIFRGEREQLVQQYAELAAGRLREALGKTLPGKASLEHRILGPAPCPFAKLRGKFRFHLLATSPDGAALRQEFKQVLDALTPSDEVQWVVDVDPLDLL